MSGEIESVGSSNSYIGVCGAHYEQIDKKENKRSTTGYINEVADIYKPSDSEEDKIDASVNGWNESSSAKTKASGSLINQFNSKFQGVLAGKGKEIAAAAEKYGIDPKLFASIIALETGWGTSSLIRNNNNPGGMRGSGDWMSFGSLSEGLDAMARNLKNNYYNQGLTTPETIGPKYCPDGSDWVGMINQISRDFA